MGGHPAHHLCLYVEREEDGLGLRLETDRSEPDLELEGLCHSVPLTVTGHTAVQRESKFRVKV